jgi:hypothetical protein
VSKLITARLCCVNKAIEAHLICAHGFAKVGAYRSSADYAGAASAKAQRARDDLRNLVRSLERRNYPGARDLADLAGRYSQMTDNIRELRDGFMDRALADRRAAAKSD